jgi:hypothetical protein
VKKMNVDPLHDKKSEVRIEFQRVQDNANQIRVLTFQPGQQEPFETIADAVQIRKRKSKRAATAKHASCGSDQP